MDSRRVCLKKHIVNWIIFITAFFLVANNRIVITSNISNFDEIVIDFCDGSNREIKITNKYDVDKIQKSFKVQFFIPVFKKHNEECVVKFFKDGKIKGHILYDSNSNTFHSSFTTKPLNTDVCRLLDTYIDQESRV